MFDLLKKIKLTKITKNFKDTNNKKKLCFKLRCNHSYKRRFWNFNGNGNCLSSGYTNYSS